jgi:hypothetical protein
MGGNRDPELSAGQFFNRTAVAPFQAPHRRAANEPDPGNAGKEEARGNLQGIVLPLLFLPYNGTVTSSMAGRVDNIFVHYPDKRSPEVG